MNTDSNERLKQDQRNIMLQKKEKKNLFFQYKRGVNRH